MSTETYWNHNTAFHDELVADAARRGGRALDVGCGDGLLVERLSSVCQEVVGVEVDAATARRARTRLAGIDGATVSTADVLEPSVGERLGTFQTVTCVATLHHLPLEDALRALASFVTPGGRLQVIGLAARSSVWDWLLAAVGVVPSWVVSRWHGGAAETGVPVAEPRESLGQIRAAARHLLPGARVRRRRYWRYSHTWDRPGRAL
ncbi:MULTISPECIES: methyltransferase [unclassified Actinomyces]|uniref:class I SAM-dependent methyltransferase n=1 Tax=unclassified Actinomyces TaxID=2609248 RepID=UPI0020170594|nr:MULTISPECIES: methyltransferase [unclassified Actinomyces]MCL3778611.1 class I SAM-dependent methyltransferase [Actinomyces sp. AC-20-1]MCL3790758.1 class I SAM-dependent methyltransferase [Actinomyces sp. 187325]MCL3793050.1 class I SAM-dependent methyltransferase [Actinomyces sp. 186855]MCL3795477.1 class I SAM-dependent methyltransferase [Actinomyces sp. 217892]